MNMIARRTLSARTLHRMCYYCNCQVIPESPERAVLLSAGLMSVPDSDENHDLRRAAEQVEDIVRQKISQPESINLCLESTSDWMNATTRHVVLKVCLHVPASV